MLRKRAIRSAAIVAISALFLAGLWRLLELRFQTGDIYPAYSSLRADPLGTRALYDSLRRIPGLKVERHFSSANRLPAGGASALLFLGVRKYDQLEDLGENLEHWARDGARVIVAFKPDASPDQISAPASPAARLKLKKARHGEESVLEGLAIQSDPSSLSKDAGALARLEASASDPLPKGLTWFSPNYFVPPTNGWRTLYAVGTNAVMIERRAGKGSIILATDSYFLSNEALRNHREPRLISWLIGEKRNLVFSESHLGVEHGSGIAVLAREYKLHGFAFGMILLVGFYVWKNAVPFVPVDPEEHSPLNEIAAQKSAREAFVNLLQKNIPPDQIIETCLAEWKKINPAGRAAMPETRREMELVLLKLKDTPARERNPVAAYRELAGILEKQDL
jgi:hypothetical protein